jgi:hypothetical protein
VMVSVRMIGTSKQSMEGRRSGSENAQLGNQ